MSRNKPKNIPASVRQRLLNHARSEKIPFNELLQYYAMERFLYRLSRSAHSPKFILKGALMLRAWRSPEVRPTMDIDMLGLTSNDQSEIIAQIRDILLEQVEPDGLVFDINTITTETITENADYKGLRIIFRGSLNTARIKMQVDIGFGDVVFPPPEQLYLPTILDFPSPRLICYSKESAIVEKFMAMIQLGELNSRMKDFYDIWLLSRFFDFKGSILAESIRIAFERKNLSLPGKIVAFDDSFAQAKQAQWTAFRKRLRKEEVPSSFADIVIAVKEFLSPIASALYSSTQIPDTWKAPGPWT